ncbi:MAG TPA: hypothetical protein VK053_09570, partial [Jiangellaceae bacterium]|nr:hypothetical protein [Jiangellaceae bacterium]
GEDAQFQSAAIERTASMYDGHPTALAREPYSSASIRIDELHSVTDDTRNPANPPYPIGSQVSLLRGDGKAWWRHWGMMIDQRDGTLLDGSANLEAVDVKHRLNTPIRQRALLSRMHEHTFFWRQIALASTWLVDKIFKDCGFNATPGQTAQSRLVVPLMGSMWPYQGTAKQAGKGSTWSAQPSWIMRTTSSWEGSTPYLSNGNAEYLMTHYSRFPETHIEVFSNTASNAASGTVYIETVNDDGIGSVLAWDNENKRFGYGSVNSSGTRAMAWHPMGNASRVGIRAIPATGTILNVRMKTNDGLDVSKTFDTTGLPSNWAATQVRVKYDSTDTSAPFRGLWVAHNPSPQLSVVDFSPTARIRSRLFNFWSFSRDIFDEKGIDVLSRMADAMCASFWIDDNGHAQWADNGVFEAQSNVFDVNTMNDIEDWGWSEDAESSAQYVRLARTRGAITSSNNRSVQVWQAEGSNDYARGETWEEFVNVPDEEDWIGVDSTFHYIDGSTPWTQFGMGTMIGATLTNQNNDGEAWSIWNWEAQLEELGYRAYKWTATFNPGSSNDRINLRVPAGSDAPNAPNAWKNKSMPVMRGYAKITTMSDYDDSYTSTDNPRGLYLHEHDVEWFIQNTGRLADMRTYLAIEMGRRWPVLSSIKILPDPRIELGDRGRFRDPHVSHSDFDGVVLGMKDTWEQGVATMELIVRPLNHRTVTQPTRPPLHWLQRSGQQWHYPD